MSRIQRRRLSWAALLVIIVCSSTLFFVLGRTRDRGNRAVRDTSRSNVRDVPMQSSTSRSITARNLALQPEAFNLSRRLGHRFSPGKHETSELVGTLTFGSERRAVRTTRLQTDDGERIEIGIAGTPRVLSWDREHGSLAANDRAVGADRKLIERLVLDSPDEFVLAQLRGASYYTVNRNVRPDDAGNDYAGPTWRVIRIDDPERDETKRPQSRWRLHYVNNRTGLIDRIVSNIDGQEFTAELSWTEVAGETVPARIIWKRQGQLLMRFDLGGFSHGSEKGASR